MKARLSDPQNHLIERLPRRDRQRLLALCKPAPLVLSDVLYQPGQPMRHVYFPTEGFVSLVTLIDGSPGLEVGMVGSEGMVGAPLALGVAAAPLRAVVQGAGQAWRLAAPAFRRELTRSPALQRVLHKYLYVLMAQLSEAAGCVHFHEIGPRLARWLLMSDDRNTSDTPIQLTHEFLAYMLGVRRVGITDAAGVFRQQGLIEYHRGALTVLNRSGLEAAACGCYAADRRVYQAVLS